MAPFDTDSGTSGPRKRRKNAAKAKPRKIRKNASNAIEEYEKSMTQKLGKRQTKRRKKRKPKAGSAFVGKLSGRAREMDRQREARKLEAEIQVYGPRKRRKKRRYYYERSDRGGGGNGKSTTDAAIAMLQNAMGSVSQPQPPVIQNTQAVPMDAEFREGTSTAGGMGHFAQRAQDPAAAEKAAGMGLQAEFEEFMRTKMAEAQTPQRPTGRGRGKGKSKGKGKGRGRGKGRDAEADADAEATESDRGRGRGRRGTINTNQDTTLVLRDPNLPSRERGVISSLEP